MPSSEAEPDSEMTDIYFPEFYYESKVMCMQSRQNCSHLNADLLLY